MNRDHLPPSVVKWLESIEASIIKADTCSKSWEYSAAYRNIIIGLSTCKGYELLLSILSEWGGAGTAGNTSGAETPEEFVDWYAVLEVSPDADAKEIRCQRNNLVMQYHPNKAPEDKKEEYNRKTAQINEAYSVLSDEIKRKSFDEKRNNHKNKK